MSARVARASAACSLVAVLASSGCWSRGTLSVLDGAGGGAADGGSAQDAASGRAAAGAPGRAGAPAAGAAPLPCEPTSSGLELTPCTASYIGGAGADRLNAATVLDDDSFVLAGTIAGPALATARSIDGGGAGALVRLGGRGAGVVAAARVPGEVLDLAFDTSRGWLVVLTSQRIHVLEPYTLAPLSAVALDSPGLRIAAAAGRFAVLRSSSSDVGVSVFDDSGARVLDLPLALGAATDVDLDPADGSLYVTGWRTAVCEELPVLRAHDAQGVLRWTAWEAGTAAPADMALCAASRGVRVVRTPTDLVFLGQSRGGNTVFDRDPLALDQLSPRAGGSSAADDTFNLYDATVVYVARIAPASGALIAGRFSVVRQPGGAIPLGAHLTPRDVAVDASGNVHLVADAACCELERAARTIAGTALGPAPEQEAQVLSLSPDLAERLHWTSFTGPGATGVFSSAGAVAAGGRLVVMAATQLSPGASIEILPLQPVASTLPEGFYAAWLEP